VYIDQHGAGERWNISSNITLFAGETSVITAIAPSSGYSFAWLENNDWNIELHLANHEV
jgi:hypothetical protein